MSKGYCPDCRAVEPLPAMGEGVYACHFAPPRDGLGFPKVLASDWCLRFEPKGAFDMANEKTPEFRAPPMPGQKQRDFDPAKDQPGVGGEAHEYGKQEIPPGEDAPEGDEEERGAEEGRIARNTRPDNAPAKRGRPSKEDKANSR